MSTEDDEGAGRRAARRRFLKGIAVVGSAAGVSGRANDTEGTQQQATTPAPDSHTRAMEAGTPSGYSAAEAGRYFVDSPGSDVMVEALRQLGVDYVASNPGSSFRGLQESVINWGGNSSPEFLTCLHEESSVGMCHGYAKVAGKPMAAALHGTVGLQHAAMAVYNAYCDKVPAILLAGNHLDATDRRNRVTWAHSVQDAAAIVRDYTKWDDTPASLQHFVESLVRAYKIAMTPPMGPVLVVADAHLQEAAAGSKRVTIPPLSRAAPPVGDAGAVAEAARLLVDAESPVIIADRVASTPAGMSRLVQLAESLEAPVIDQFGRMNFPNDHYLNHSFRARQLLSRADVILGLEVEDFWGTVNRLQDRAQLQEARIARSDAKLISLGAGELFFKSNYQNFARYMPVDLAITGDAEATLPELIESIQRLASANRRSRFAERAQRLRQDFVAMKKAQREAAVYAWNASPVSTARLCMEVWELIKDRDWCVTSSEMAFQSYWPQRLWTMNTHQQFIGGSGGYGVGYGAPAAVGAAIANRPFDRKFPGGRGHDVRTWRVLDRSASWSAAAVCDAQQPGLSSRDYAHPENGAATPAGR